MCLAVPLRVIRIENGYAQVVLGGVERRVSIVMTPEARVGDYVLVHAGYAIGVLDEAEAQETLALLAEVAAAAAEQEEAGSTDSPEEGQGELH